MNNITLDGLILNKKLFEKSIFTEIDTVEFVDIKLINNFIDFETGIIYKDNIKYTEFYKIFNINCEKDIIIEYRKKNYDDLYFRTSYIMPKYGWGRIKPLDRLSVSVFHTKTRNIFCKDSYVNIDMINSSPSILYQFCKIKNIKCDYLEKYILDPKIIQNEIMYFYNCDIKNAKRLIYMLIGGGLYDSWIRSINSKLKINYIINFEEELKNIIRKIYNDNKNIINDVRLIDPLKWKTKLGKKQKKKQNMLYKNNIEAEIRGVIGLFLQSLERLFQEHAIKFLVDRKNLELKTIIPCQDGFMILKEYNYLNLCEDISNEIYNTWNIRIFFKEKYFN